jgi:glycine dehydrogenase subunit 1
LNYFPLTSKDRQDIKEEIGIKDVKELFSDLPTGKSYFPLKDIPVMQAENVLIKDFNSISNRNKFQEYLSFLGGGAYDHFIPEVAKNLSGRSEFLTPYTPYQPEVSQGTLMAMFEYQTMLCQLTGLDISNCSLYDGGTAAAEALLLAMRMAKNKKKFLLAENLHPEYRTIIETYLQNLDYELEFVNFSRETGQVDIEDLEIKMTQEIGGFLFQSPNFFGAIEDSRKISDIVHSVKKASSVQIVAEAMSLPFLISPGESGVDVVAGEAQSFGLSLSYGGPYLGFMSARANYLRQLPGRIVGETKDLNGKRGYVLTISTREQHIRREKATSNICTNSAWCALRASIYLATMGRRGMREIAELNHHNTAYFAEQIAGIPGIELKFKSDFFNEIVLKIKNKTAELFLNELKEEKILGGVDLSWFFSDLKHSVLINFTENHSKKDIDRLIHVLGEKNE